MSQHEAHCALQSRNASENANNNKCFSLKRKSFERKIDFCDFHTHQHPFMLKPFNTSHRDVREKERIICVCVCVCWCLFAGRMLDLLEREK